MNNKMIPNFILENDLPCLNYIKGIPGRLGVDAFLKNYVGVYCTLDMDWNTIATRCAAKCNRLYVERASTDENVKLLNLNGLSVDASKRIRRQFSAKNQFLTGESTKDTAIEWVKTVLKKESAYENCGDYYASFNPNRECCKLCPLSCHYANHALDSETELLRTCFMDQDSIDLATSSGITASDFFAVYDLAANDKSKAKPFLVNHTKMVWGFFTAPDLRKEIFSLTSINERLALIEGYFFKRVLLQAQGSMPNALSSTVSILVQDLLGGDFNNMAAPETDPLSAVNSFILNKSSKRENFSDKDCISYYKPPQKTLPIWKKVDNGESKAGLETGSSLHIVTKGMEPALQKDNSVILKKSCTENFLPTVYNECALDQNETPEKPEVLHIVPDVSAEQIIFHDETAYSGEYRPFAGSMVSVPSIKKEELFAFATDLDHAGPRALNTFTNSITGGLRPCKAPVKADICIELVCIAPENYVYLMFVPSLGKYFYTTLKNGDVRQILDGAFRYSSLSKYCYMPYMLTASLRQNGIKTIKSLKSIFTLSSVLMPNHAFPMHKCLTELGAVSWHGDNIDDFTSPVIHFMHCYHRIYKKALLRIKDQGMLKVLDEANRMDELLSYSFLHETKNGIGCLFYLKDSSKRIFPSATNAEHPDSSVWCYNIRSAMPEASRMIRELLFYLQEERVMRKTNAYILCMSNHFVTFAVNRNKEAVLREQVLQAIEYLSAKNGYRYFDYTRTPVAPGQSLIPAQT